MRHSDRRPDPTRRLYENNPSPLVTLALLASFLVTTSCEKAYHEETEKFIFVAANINLPYWQEAKAGLNDAALAMHVKEDFTGPESYDVNQELAFFQSAVASHPTGILLQAPRPALFKSDIDKAVQQGIPVVTVDSDAPDS